MFSCRFRVRQKSLQLRSTCVQTLPFSLRLPKHVALFRSPARRPSTPQTSSSLPLKASLWEPCHSSPFLCADNCYNHWTAQFYRFIVGLNLLHFLSQLQEFQLFPALFSKSYYPPLICPAALHVLCKLCRLRPYSPEWGISFPAGQKILHFLKNLFLFFSKSITAWGTQGGRNNSKNFDAQQTLKVTTIHQPQVRLMWADCLWASGLKRSLHQAREGDN